MENSNPEKQMNPKKFKKEYSSALTAVLWIALYSRQGSGGFLGSLLAGTMACLTGGAVFFLRIWLPVVWTQGFCVLITAIVCQAAWMKAQLMPWWALAVLGLTLPMGENLRAEGVMKVFVGQCGLFFVTANVFLLLRNLLEQSSFSLLGEHGSGIFLILGLSVLLMQTLRPAAKGKNA